MLQIFRFLGDLLMVLSRAILIRKIIQTKSVSGLSLNTQILYLVSYLFRYLDLFSSFSNLNSFMKIYNILMKLLFISYQVTIIFLILVKFRNTYARRHDTFNIHVLILASLGIGILVKCRTLGFMYYFEELFYTSSLVLESVAILPQLAMIQEAGESESLTAIHIMLLGLYRLSYVIHFSLKAYSGGPVDSVLIISGVVQTLLYADFYIIYYKKLADAFSFSANRKIEIN